MNTIVVIGKPNSGKSLLFSRLTGIRAKVANFPGVTVQIQSGRFEDVVLLDHPGTYSLHPVSEDETVAVSKLKEELQSIHNKGVLCVLDATQPAQSLVLGLQVQELATQHQKPVVFALNMIDACKDINCQEFAKDLSAQLEAPVLTVSAKTGEGLSAIQEEIRTMNRGLCAVKSHSLPMVNGEGVLLGHFPKASELSKKHLKELLKRTTFDTKLDQFFLSTWMGGIVFVLIMAVLFQSIFTGAAPLMDTTEMLISWLGVHVSDLLNQGLIHDFVSEAIFGGLGSFLVFVPQIFILTFVVGLLEDSGYLARASIIVHKPLSLFGLTGKSFVPYLSGYACAIPAIMAARTIESPRKRFLTMLVVPLAACSARLPVYTLIIAAVIPKKHIAWGLFGAQGMAFFAIYILGLAMALVVSSILSRIKTASQNDMPFVLELPPYRVPHLKPLLLRSIQSAREFLFSAGPIIFAVTVVVWFLGYFPEGEGALANSYLAKMGRAIEPLVQPFGLDWIYGVAVLTSFVAREVFVGTLGTLVGISDAEGQLMDLASALKAHGLTLASGIALLVFYAIALQCTSTLAVLKKELGSWKIPLSLFVAYGVLAYLAALVAYAIFVNL